LITAHHEAWAASACPGLKLTDARAAAATKIVRIISFNLQCRGFVITPRRLSLFQSLIDGLYKSQIKKSRVVGIPIPDK
jgi:hypothetical protein